MNAAALRGMMLLLAAASVTAGVAILFGAGWAFITAGLSLALIVIGVPTRVVRVPTNV